MFVPGSGGAAARSHDDGLFVGPGGLGLWPLGELIYDAVPAESDRLPWLRQELATWATGTGMPSEVIDSVVLATDEAMSNVVSHAYPDQPGTFDLHAVHRPDLTGIEVTVRDRGRWRYAPPDPGSLHGRGLLLIKALAHGVTIDRGPRGTVVTMAWSLLTS